MKNILKKISIVLAALMLIGTIYVVSDSQVALAAQTEYTVTFHYTRADGNISGATITAWASGTSGSADPKSFQVNGNEGVCEYKFTFDPDVDVTEVNFITQCAGITDFANNNQSYELESIVQNIYIYVDSDNNASWDLTASSEIQSGGETTSAQTETTTQTTSEIATQPTSEAVTQPAEQPTTAAQTGIGTESTSQTSTQSNVVKENNKDYSVGFFQALIIDIILFAILGGLSFVALSKEKKPLVKKK